MASMAVSLPLLDINQSFQWIKYSEFYIVNFSCPSPATPFRVGMGRQRRGWGGGHVLLQPKQCDL